MSELFPYVLAISLFIVHFLALRMFVSYEVTMRDLSENYARCISTASDQYGLRSIYFGFKANLYQHLVGLVLVIVILLLEALSSKYYIWAGIYITVNVLSLVSYCYVIKYFDRIALKNLAIAIGLLFLANVICLFLILLLCLPIL